MRLELARMFLSLRSQKDAFERKNANGSEMNREQWLRLVFEESIDFNHQKSERYYVPDKKRDDRKDERIISRIGRRSTIKENDPDDYLHEVQREQWKACLVIIDPTTHADGQKVAIEVQGGVGSGFSNLESLVNSVNSRTPPEPYAIELNSITDQTSFWEYVDNNKGNVTSVTLEIAMPNMFGGSSSFEEDAKRLRDKEKARRLRETIENPDGLEPDTERMRDAVQYVTRGGGKAQARAKGVPGYDSTKNKKIVEADIDEDDEDADKKANAALDALDNDDTSNGEDSKPVSLSVGTRLERNEEDE